MINRVHNKIRSIRIEKNLSQEYIATQLNISQSYYAKIENGKSNLTLSDFFKILDALETDVDFFFNQLNQKED